MYSAPYCFDVQIIWIKRFSWFGIPFGWCGKLACSLGLLSYDFIYGSLVIPCSNKMLYYSIFWPGRGLFSELATCSFSGSLDNHGCMTPSRLFLLAFSFKVTINVPNNDLHSNSDSFSLRHSENLSNLEHFCHGTHVESSRSTHRYSIPTPTLCKYSLMQHSNVGLISGQASCRSSV